MKMVRSSIRGWDEVISEVPRRPVMQTLVPSLYSRGHSASGARRVVLSLIHGHISVADISTWVTVLITLCSLLECWWHCKIVLQ